MTTFNPSFSTAKCAKCSTLVGFTKAVPKGPVYCTKHASVSSAKALLNESIANGVPEDQIIKTDAELDAYFLGDGTTTAPVVPATTEAAATEEADLSFDAFKKDYMKRINTGVKCITNGCSNIRHGRTEAGEFKQYSYLCLECKGKKTPATGETSVAESKYTLIEGPAVKVPASEVPEEVKAKSKIKEKVENNMKSAKEKAVKQVSTVGEFVKAKYTSIKESRLSKWIKKTYHSAIGFLGNKKTAIAVGSASVMAGGIVTGSAVAAVAVGTAVAVAVVGASHAMQKKKEEKLSYKAMLTDMGVATATVAVMPFLLLALSYVGLYATMYGAVLPYAIIVA